MHTFYEDSRRLSKRLLNIHMSRVNFDKQYHCQFFYMSCISVTLHLPVHFVTNNASIRLYQPNFKMHDVHVLW